MRESKGIHRSGWQEEKEGEMVLFYINFKELKRIEKLVMKVNTHIFLLVFYSNL